MTGAKGLQERHLTPKPNTLCTQRQVWHRKPGLRWVVACHPPTAADTCSVVDDRGSKLQGTSPQTQVALCHAPLHTSVPAYTGSWQRCRQLRAPLPTPATALSWVQLGRRGISPVPGLGVASSEAMALGPGLHSSTEEGYTHSSTGTPPLSASQITVVMA